jgi:D-alanyl-D-alanine carboxypeptidase
MGINLKTHNFIFKTIVAIFISILFHKCKIDSIEEGRKSIRDLFYSTATSSTSIKNATFLLYSKQLNLDEKYSYTSLEKSNIGFINQPFHIASIGKLFTLVLLLQLEEEKKLNLNDPILKYLDKNSINGLFVINGIDHSNEVTIDNLISHTSGVADYFGSDENDKSGVLIEILNDPNKFWEPLDLINYSISNQKPVGKPNQLFHYSDTGYILLGLIVESITKIKFEDLLQEKIFKPLDMNSTYMHLRSKPLVETNLKISNMMLGNKEVTNFKSLSADWSGGGIISTVDDLLKLHKAFIEGRLFTKINYLKLSGENKFHNGIFYGKGLMTIKYGEMFFLMPDLPFLYGHSGLLGTLLFYTPEYDSYIILNLGSTADVSKSFEFMFRLMMILKDIKNL